MSTSNHRRSKGLKSNSKPKNDATFKLIRVKSKVNPFSFSCLPHFLIEAVRRKILIPTDLMVVAEVMSWIDEDISVTECWVFNDVLAAKTGMHPRSISRSISNIADAGFFVLGKKPTNPKARRKITLAWRTEGFEPAWVVAPSTTSVSTPEAVSPDRDVVVELDISVHTTTTPVSTNKKPRIKNPYQEEILGNSTTTPISPFEVTLPERKQRANADIGQESSWEPSNFKARLPGILDELADPNIKIWEQRTIIDREGPNLTSLLIDDEQNLNCNRGHLWKVAQRKVSPTQFMQAIEETCDKMVENRVERPGACFTGWMKKFVADASLDQAFDEEIEDRAGQGVVVPNLSYEGIHDRPSSPPPVPALTTDKPVQQLAPADHDGKTYAAITKACDELRRLTADPGMAEQRVNLVTYNVQSHLAGSGTAKGGPTSQRIKNLVEAVRLGYPIEDFQRGMLLLARERGKHQSSDMRTLLGKLPLTPEEFLSQSGKKPIPNKARGRFAKR